MKLAELRHGRDWSLRELAKRSGVPKSTISAIEKGTRRAAPEVESLLLSALSAAGSGVSTKCGQAVDTACPQPETGPSVPIAIDSGCPQLVDKTCGQAVSTSCGQAVDTRAEDAQRWLERIDKATAKQAAPAPVAAPWVPPVEEKPDLASVAAKHKHENEISFGLRPPDPVPVFKVSAEAKAGAERVRREVEAARAASDLPLVFRR